MQRKALSLRGLSKDSLGDELKDDNSTQYYAFKVTKRTAMWLLSIGLLGCVFIPTTKDMLLTYCGGTIIEYCKNSEEVKQIPDKTITIINNLLDEYINEQKK